MKTLSIREARAALSRVDDILAEEGEVLITRRGKAVARLLPVRPRKPVPSHAELRASMRPLSVPSEVYIRAERDER
jgi:prevent-host-death family protein